MSLVKKFASVGGATMASRVLGFVREALIGAALGSGPVADAFYAAFRFPNLFRRIFAEGAFNTAFIPLFAKSLEGGGEDEARRFAEHVLSVLISVLLALSALALIAMPLLVGTIIAPKFADIPDKFDLTVLMTRIMFPYLFCMSLVAMFSGILNSFRRYFLAAFVPVLLNAILIAALLCALYTGAEPRMTGLWLAWGVCLSGFAQLALLVWGVMRLNFPMRLTMPHFTPDVKRLLVLMGPAVVTGGVTQINLLIGQMIASAQNGAIALLNYADRLNQLPLGVIGVAIGVVLLPELSRSLRAGADRDAEHLQNRSLEFAWGLTLPAAVGMMVMPAPMINIVYERGAFTSETTQLAAAALAAFAAGLPSFVLVKVFSPAFFAREDMRSPLYFSIAAVATNVVFSLALFGRYGHVAIAIATSVSGWVNFLLLAGTLWTRNQFRPSTTTLRRVWLIALASAAVGFLLYFAQLWFPEAFGHPRLLVRLAAVIGAISLSMALYFAIVIATGAIDRSLLLRALRRKR
jgi:putative peptidoglycan lipid II flippase